MAHLLGKRALQEADSYAVQQPMGNVGQCEGASLGVKRLRKALASSADEEKPQSQRQYPAPQQQCSNAPATQVNATVHDRHAHQGSFQQTLACVGQNSLYYGQSSLPINGWFHPCRCCHSWTANTVETVDPGADPVPICKRCIAKLVASARPAGQTTNPAPVPQREVSANGSASTQNTGDLTDGSRSSSLFGPMPTTPQSFSNCCAQHLS